MKSNLSYTISKLHSSLIIRTDVRISFFSQPQEANLKLRQNRKISEQKKFHFSAVFFARFFLYLNILKLITATEHKAIASVLKRSDNSFEKIGAYKYTCETFNNTYYEIFLNL